MHRSINIVKQIQALYNGVILYEWEEATASLFLGSVRYKAAKGGMLWYSNPPVHQVGNPGLAAYLEALGIVAQKKDDYSFLILSGANVSARRLRFTSSRVTPCPSRFSSSRK